MKSDNTENESELLGSILNLTQKVVGFTTMYILNYKKDVFTFPIFHRESGTGAISQIYF